MRGPHHRVPATATFFLALLASTACRTGAPDGRSSAATTPPAKGDASSTAGNDPVTRALGRLGPALLSAVRDAQPDEAALVSSFSVYAALAMVEGGARGATREELRQALFIADALPAETDQAYADLMTRMLASRRPADAERAAVDVRVANAIWLDELTRPSEAFLQRNRDFYGAEVSSQDLQAPGMADVINGWIHDATDGHIGPLLDEISPAMVAVLANAVYLKAPWDEPFEAGVTKNRPFHRADGSTVEVPTMRTTLGQAHYRASGTFEAVRLAFDGGSGAMTIYRPRNDQDPDDVVAALAEERRSGGSAAGEQTLVQLSLPRFRVEWRGSLRDRLEALGIRRAFDPAQADFGDLHAGPFPTWIDDVIHGAFADVDEAGLEATAATVITMVGGMPSGEPPQVLVLEVDRPFVFEIEMAGASLFMGVIEDPSILAP